MVGVNCSADEFCTAPVALRLRGFGLPFCVKHARKAYPEPEHWARDFTPLVSPRGQQVVIFPYEEANRGHKGLIILPPWYRQRVTGGTRMMKNANALPFGLGVVLAVGPGSYPRSDGDKWAWSWKKDRTPMTATVGDRVVYRRQFEGAVTDWRGLVLCWDFDVLGAIEEEDEACQATA